VDLVNVWMQKVAVIEGKAAAAADLGAVASGAQKATAAIASVAPDVEAILLKYKLLPLSQESLQKINNAVLDIANELEPAPVAAPVAAPAA
jgi:predicted nuclease with RNAse H fold